MSTSVSSAVNTHYPYNGEVELTRWTSELVYISVSQCVSLLSRSGSGLQLTSIKNNLGIPRARDSARTIVKFVLV